MYALGFTDSLLHISEKIMHDLINQITDSMRKGVDKFIIPKTC